MATLITGVAGFIGYHLAGRMDGDIVGIDNLNDYYPIWIKEERLEELKKNPRFTFHRADISDMDALESIFERYRPELVVNLAGQAGVRYSRENPMAYIQGNVTGFLNVIECCSRYNEGHLIYASSSSVYGNANGASRESDTPDPQSLYAATKLFDENIAKTYGIRTTGLRFFTVYGEKGRPDMFIPKVIDAAVNGKAVTLYGDGNLRRDFTYVGDIVDGIVRAARTEGDMHRIYNLGSSNPISTGEVVDIVEEAMGTKISRIYADKPNEDVEMTFADIDKARRELGWTPRTTLREYVRTVAGRLHTSV